MERNGKHLITYTNRGSVPVSDVAASLLANEQLLREAIALVQEILPGLKVEEVNIDFRSAQSQSPLKELLAYSLIVVYQEDLNKATPELVENMLGIDIPDNLEPLITVLVLVVAIYGISKLFELVKVKKDAGAAADATPLIEGNYNNVVNVAGDLIGMDPEAITEALERRYAGKKSRSLGRKALEFIRPAKREDGASIEGAGASISPDTIRAAPASYEVQMDDDEAPQDPYTAQAIVIHATDLDSNKTGWAGHLPGLWEKRLKMRLYPTINPAEIYGKREITGDIIVVSKRDASGEYVPDLFHVLKIY